MNWRFFIGAGILAGYFLLAAGAPPLAVGAGIAGAGVFQFVRRRG